MHSAFECSFDMSSCDTSQSLTSSAEIEGLPVLGHASALSGLLDGGHVASEHCDYLGTKVTDQLSQLPFLLRGSVILGQSRSLTDLASYDHAWRFLQENYGDVGALIGQREAFSCAHNITAAIVDVSAKHCFLSGPYGCGKSVVIVAASFLLLLCGKVRTIAVCSNKRDKSRTILKMMQMTCDAAAAYIAEADLPSSAKTMLIANIQQLSNMYANAVFHFISTSEACIWPSSSDSFLVWDAPIPVSSTIAQKLKQFSCVLVVSSLPLSLAQACDDSDLIPISTYSLELKMEYLSQEVNALMNKIKRLQVQKVENVISGNAIDATHANTAQENQILSLHFQMREKIALMESQTLKSICHQRAFYFAPKNGFRSLVSYSIQGMMQPSWAMGPEHPSSIHAIHRILLPLLNSSGDSHHGRIAVFLFRQEVNMGIMQALCASIGVKCVLHPILPDFRSIDRLVVICALVGNHLAHAALPKTHVALFFAEPCLDSDVHYICEVMMSLQRQLCGFDHEFDGRESDYPFLYLPQSLLKLASESEFDLNCMSPQSFRSYFHPICGSIILKV
jgi:hypothetical protein